MKSPIFYNRNQISVVRFWFGLWLLSWCIFVQAQSYIEIPKLSSRVTDLTGTLSPTQVETLESKLAAFEVKKGSQIAVLMVPTTQPSEIEEFGIEVADLWKLGREKSDDGLILIVAKDDRKVRLEVYDGLEGVIPDAIAKRIGTETIAPFFKKDDYYGGINAGIDQIMSLIENEPLPPPSPRSNSKGDSFIFLLFGGLFAGSLFSSMFGRVTGGILAGIGSGFIASLIMGFGIGSIVIGIIVFFLTSTRFTGGGGGWSNGGGGYYGGGGSWGGGGSGGAWSGGGGHASGGGATSSW
jgi:uncharacterized protein